MAVPELPALLPLPDLPVLTPILWEWTWGARAGQDNLCPGFRTWQEPETRVCPNPGEKGASTTQESAGRVAGQKTMLLPTDFDCIVIKRHPQGGHKYHPLGRCSCVGYNLHNWPWPLHWEEEIACISFGSYILSCSAELLLLLEDCPLSS